MKLNFLPLNIFKIQSFVKGFDTLVVAAETARKQAPQDSPGGLCFPSPEKLR